VTLLFSGDALGEIARLVDVAAELDGEVVAEIVNDVDSVRFFRKALRILEERPPNQSKADSPQPAPSCDPEPIHTVALAIALRDMAQRLGSVEEKFEADRRAKPAKGSFLIEFFKVIFGGWPALGLLFLILFYAPLRDALNAIPEKVKNAAEFGAFGVSLKSTVQIEAAKLGAGSLSETIPKLSGAAIERLLRAPRNLESLVSYTQGSEGKGRFIAINFPGLWEMDALSELEAEGLIELESHNGEVLTGPGAREMIDQFLKANPGHEEESSNDERVTWNLDKPLVPDAYPLSLQWRLTNLGRKAVEVILKAVSAELAPKSTPKPNP
jgi:hypothetical protein